MGLAAEAGYRWGDLALSGGKLPRWLGGGQMGGLAGMAERMGFGQTTEGAIKAAGLTAAQVEELFSGEISPR